MGIEAAARRGTDDDGERNQLRHTLTSGYIVGSMLAEAAISFPKRWHC
jgi:hypothetical protein